MLSVLTLKSSFATVMADASDSDKAMLLNSTTTRQPGMKLAAVQSVCMLPSHSRDLQAARALDVHEEAVP